MIKSDMSREDIVEVLDALPKAYMGMSYAEFCTKLGVAQNQTSLVMFKHFEQIKNSIEMVGGTSKVADLLIGYAKTEITYPKSVKVESDPSNIRDIFAKLLNNLRFYKPGDRSELDRHMALTIDRVEDAYGRFNTFCETVLKQK